MLFGIIAFLLLVLRSKFVGRKNLDEYAEARNKLTFREKPKIKWKIPEFSGFIVILVGIALVGPITEQVGLITTSSNITGSAAYGMVNLVSFVPIFFILAIVMAGLGIAYSSIRSSGLL